MSTEDLFASLQPATAALVQIDGPKNALSREQRSFNRLTGEIARKRRQLEDWHTFLTEFQGRAHSSLQPLREKHYGIELALVRRLDAVLASRTDVRLKKRERSVLTSYLVECLHGLLESESPDTDELNALLLRHSGEDIHALREVEQAFERELAETMLGSLFGEDVLEDYDGDDVESLFEHVNEKVRSREAEQASATGKRRSKRQEAAAQRREQAEREASQSVRDVFRKLASTLHPDREADPELRERKTELMQRVTRAYQDNDLLQLLSLQIEIEQIDAGQLGALDDARLKHYNAVLREQSRALDVELSELVEPAAMTMGLHTPRPNVGQFESALRQQMAEIRRYCTEARAELAALDNDRLRAELIKRLDLRQKAEQAEMEAEADFALTFGPLANFGFIPDPFSERGPAPPKKRKRKSRKRK